MRGHPQFVVPDSVIEEVFDDLYRDLCRAFPHPLEWTCLLECPRWWRRRKRRAYRKVFWIFIRHGFVLRDDLARAFFLTPPQQPGEDCGGAMVRRLRTVWEAQIGLPVTRDVLDG